MKLTTKHAIDEIVTAWILIILVIGTVYLFLTR